jgi:sigma-B regulation protein RsbU (phosphoserine phosphatase)
MTPRVLVVDDEPDLEPLILQRFRRKIRDGEIEFRFARNGEEALSVLDEDPSINLVLSDINMPVMDGLTLLTRIAGLDRMLKTVIVSAYDDMRNIRVAMNRGAFDFLTKPIDFQDFETTLVKTLQEIASIREFTKHRTELVALQNELAVANRIQQAILPREFPTSPHFEIYARMLPARTVGGDFYDFFELGKDRLAFAVGDVSGKGVPAAIYMAVSRTLLRATALQGRNPLECMLHVNHVLLRQGEGDMFVTLFYGQLHTLTGEVEYCIAGHQAPCVISEERGLEVLQGRGTMLGIFDDPEVATGTLQLAPGDVLFSCTDGVIDAERPDEQNFTEAKLLEALHGCAGRPARDIVTSVFHAVTEFSAGAPQADDVTALALRFLASPAAPHS